MNTINPEWKHMSIPFNDALHQALIQQHHAAQFIALAGHYLIPQKPDDSNTNMAYFAESDLLVGNILPNGLSVALKLTDLRLRILNQQSNIQKEIILEGKTKREIFKELKQKLSDLGVDVAGFKNELHYKIPLHQLDNGAAFSVKKENNFIENAQFRQNAQFVIEKIVKDYDEAEPVKIWPHHFDTGSFIPVSHNKQGELSQSIGIGWAMPDSMVNEPYYYLSFWSKTPLEGINKLKALEIGDWKMPDWNGAVLKLSVIMNSGEANEQFQAVMSFYKSGNKMILDLLNN